MRFILDYFFAPTFRSWNRDYRLLWGCAVIYATRWCWRVNVKIASFSEVGMVIPSVLMHGAYMVGLQAAIIKQRLLASLLA